MTHNPASGGEVGSVTGPAEPPAETESGGLGTPVAPPSTGELETDKVPEELIEEFSSLTTPYCWVITEDLIARYDGAEPTAVGRAGPGRAFAIGRLYDPSGENERAPLDDFGRATWSAERIEYRSEGQWQPI